MKKKFIIVAMVVSLLGLPGGVVNVSAMSSSPIVNKEEQNVNGLQREQYLTHVFTSTRRAYTAPKPGYHTDVYWYAGEILWYYGKVINEHGAWLIYKNSAYQTRYIWL